MLKFNIGQYMPQSIMDLVPKGKLPIDWSAHARSEAYHDAGLHDVPEYLNMGEGRVVEIECGKNPRTNKLYVEKFVVRFSLDQGVNDLVMAVAPCRNGGWGVKTCWVNKTRDRHSTLKRQALVSPPVCSPC